MAEDGPIELGDKVITLQMPGIFTVTGRQGPALVIESDDGVRLTVVESGLRRMDAEAPVADEPSADDAPNDGD